MLPACPRATRQQTRVPLSPPLLRCMWHEIQLKIMTHPFQFIVCALHTDRHLSLSLSLTLSCFFLWKLANCNHMWSNSSRQLAELTAQIPYTQQRLPHMAQTSKISSLNLALFHFNEARKKGRANYRKIQMGKLKLFLSHVLFALRLFYTLTVIPLALMAFFKPKKVAKTDLPQIVL